MSAAMMMMMTLLFSSESSGDKPEKDSRLQNLSLSKAGDRFAYSSFAAVLKSDSCQENFEVRERKKNKREREREREIYKQQQDVVETLVNVIERRER